MKTMFQKHQILESISKLDQTQTEQVLAYINSLRNRKSEEHPKTKAKRDAMMQIKQALGKERKFQPTF